jgi:hypothetical protein
MQLIVKGKHGPVVGVVVGGAVGALGAIFGMGELPVLARIFTVAFGAIGGFVAGLLLWAIDRFSGTDSCPKCGKRKPKAEALCAKCGTPPAGDLAK